MNIALRKAMTVDDYLAWAAVQREAPRSELINGQIVFMSPEQLAHTRIKGSVYFAIRQAITAAAIEAEVLTHGATVPIDAHTGYEPDATVRLGAPLPGRGMKVPDPIIVVEVLSPTSVHMDTSAKLIGYFKLPSVHHYLIIDPDATAVAHHSRGANGTVSGHTVTSGTIRLDPPGLSIDVSEIFE